MITITKTTKTYLGGKVIVEKETKSFGGKVITIKGPLVKKIIGIMKKNKKVMVKPSLFYFFHVFHIFLCFF